MQHNVLRKHLTIALFVGTLLYTSQALAAQDAEFQLDQITVTADRIVQTVGGTPANVTVITRAELQAKGARNLIDALAGVSGVMVRSHGGAGEKALPYIMGSERIVVLVDGKRMNLPQGVGYGASVVDLSSFLVSDSIERIEVIRGGASVLYGADAVGGVINIITKKGADATKVTTGIAGGSDGGRAYDLSAGGQQGKTSWQVSGIRDASDGQRSNSAYKNNNVTFRLDQEMTAGESLTLTFDHYNSHAGMPGSLTNPSSTDYQDMRRNNWSVAYTKNHTAGSRFFRYYDNSQTYSGIEYESFRHKNTVRAFEYQDSARLNNANLLTWGGEWRQEKVDSTIEGSTLHSGITRAVYLQDQIRLSAAATLTLGLRRNDSDIYGVQWLPKLAYLYQANERTSYFANWGKVFRAPNFDDLYTYKDYGGGYVCTGDPNLKPETGWTAEAGVKSRLNSANEITLSFFKRELTDAISWSGVKTPVNIDRLSSTGVNANLVSKLSPAVTLNAGYTYLDSRKQDNNDAGDPRHSFHVGVTAKKGKLTQTLYGIYQDRIGTGSEEVGSHFVVHTNTSYQLDKETTVYLTVRNRFDRQYEYVKGYPANGRSFLLGIRRTM